MKSPVLHSLCTVAQHVRAALTPSHPAGFKATLILGVALLATSAEVLAADLYVKAGGGCAGSPCYSTVTAALAAAANDDVIHLESNVTEGLVYITKDITLDGHGFKLSSTSGTYGIEVGATSVTIQNLTVETAGTFGIQADCDAHNLALTNVTVNNCGGTGISLNGSDGVVLTNVTSTNNDGNGVSVTNCNSLSINGITTSGNAFPGGFNAGIGLFTSSAFCLPAGINGFSLTGTVSIAENPKVYSQKANAADMITGLSGSSIQWAVGTSATDRSYWSTLAVAYAAVDALFEAPYNLPNTTVFVEEVATGNLYVNDNPNGDATPPMLIQTAINFAVAGKTIFVEGGSYNQRVTITKSLTLDGAGTLSTLLDGTGLAAGSSGITINSGVTNVTIKDMAIQNFTGSGPNSTGGVYATGGNNFLTLQNLDVVNNPNCSGVFIVGSSGISDVLIDGIKSHGHGAPGNPARGIVIWDGFKNNITISNCEVYSNNCCGIEFQDGTASGVTMTNNNVHDNFDSGMSALGLTGPNANLISANTVKDNGRFGIEIKLPNGSGATSGAGSIVVQNNTVTRTTLPGLAELRDLAGIAVFRRAYNTVNANIPTGVVVRNNTVSGYRQTSDSEGFGIVIEGTNHEVSNNILNNNDVGIQQQAGHVPYVENTSTDGNQADMIDVYFGRGNTPFSCGNDITANTFGTGGNANDIDSRDVGAAVNTTAGVVVNTNNGETFCSIQTAINDGNTVNGHTISANNGTYNEYVTINKEITVQGQSAATIIKAPYSSDNSQANTVLILSNNVTLKKFTVTRDYGANLAAWNACTVNQGINYNTRSNVTLDELTVTGNRNGIFCNNSPNTTITRCTVENNRTGLHFGGNITGAVVTNNFLRYNFTHGLLFNYDLNVLTATNVNVEDNNISSNWYSQVNFQRGSGAPSNVGSTSGLDFSCNWYGSTAPTVNAIAAGEPGYTAQIPSQFGGANPMLMPARYLLGQEAALIPYSPWTVNGTDDDLVATGFQPVAGSCVGTQVAITIATNTPATCLGGPNNGALTTITSSGTAPFTYLWSNMATTPNLSGVPAGSYSVTVTDFYGTTASASATVIYLPVTNVTTGLSYATIQAAINAGATGNEIQVCPGTYNEQVLVNKGVKILGVGMTQPTVDFTGTVTGKPTLFDVSVDGATIENIHFNVDLAKLKSAIIASGAGIDNITVKGNVIDAYGTPVSGNYTDRNAVSINFTGNTNYRVAIGGVNNIIFQNNTVNGSGAASYFRAGVCADEAGGTFTGNTLKTINQDVQVRFGGNGNITVSNNNFNGGGVELAEHNAGAGTITVANNIFDATFANTAAAGTAVLRLKNNQQMKTTLVNNNTFNNHEWAVSLENYNTVTLDNNTFTPKANSTTYHHVTVNTKSISTNSATIVQTTIGATLTNNTFNGSGTPGGTALSFHNHDSDNASFGTFTLGTAGNENNFNAGIATFLRLDDQTGTSSGATFPSYTAQIGSGAGALTTMACWTPNVDIQNNKFNVGAGLQLPSAMSYAQRTTLETNLYHHPDNFCLGYLIYFYPVHNINQNTYYLTIQAAINAANPNDVIECAEYTFTEKVNITKTLTLQGISEANTILDGTGLGNGSGITVASGVTNVWIKYFTIRNHAGTSPNLFAGIYAPSGNNGLKVEHCTLKDNVGGSGLYANGPINLLTLNDLDVSGHTAIAGAARGIVVWNGLKSNISITNCDVYNNNCCGIELQDGSASGVTMTNNNVHDNWDSGMSAVGLDGSVGANTISSNTVTNNGRFGIEIKNPNGNGSNITVSNNVVSLTASFVASRPTEKRDLAGIAAFRRGVLGTNVDVPTGVDIINNTVSGYVQDNGASASEGFGIVVEGTNHTVTGNTVTGNDVGIQQQAGHLPYPGDGDQSDLADTYFGRGNSAATCGNTVSGNTLTNGIDTRNVGAIGSGFVANTTTGETFCSIQAGIDDAQTLNTHTLTVSAGTYNEAVVLNKSLTLDGASPATVLVNPTAPGTNGITISAANSTVRDLRVTATLSGIVTSAAGITLRNVESVSNGSNGVSVSNGTTNLTIINSKLNNNAVVGLRSGTLDVVTNLLIDSSEVKGNVQGIANFAATTAAAWDNAIIRNSDFSNNTQKGMYFERFNNLLIDRVTMDNSGTDAAYGFNNGIDVNLKYHAYTGLTITNSVFTNCGAIGTATNPDNPSVLAIKQRDDAPSYNAQPAALSNVLVKNNLINGPRNGIRFGETGKINGGATSVSVEGNHLAGPFAYKTIINNTNQDVDLLCNWHGTTDLATIQASLLETGSGDINLSTVLNSGGDASAAVGFQPAGLCDCPSGNLVTNGTTLETFCSIQAAIDDAQTLTGHTLEVSPGTYYEQVLVNKGVTIIGVGMTQPTVDFTGTVTGKPTLFDVSVDGVSIQNLHFNVDLAKLKSAIIASGAGIDNINIIENVIDAYGTPVAGNYTDRNAVSINFTGNTNYRVATGGVNNITFQGNTVNGSGASYFRAGVCADEAGGTFTGNTLKTINQDVQVRFGSNGNITVSNNNFNGGGVELAEHNAGAGTITVSNNVFDGTFANVAVTPRTAVLRLKNNQQNKVTVVSGNTFNNHLWAISLENYRNVSVDDNDFTPLASSTDFLHIGVNTKSISSNSSTIVQTTVDGSFTKNTFNGSGVAGGTGIGFFNHDSDNAAFGTFTIGGSAANANEFNAQIGQFIRLDNQTGSTNPATNPTDYPDTGSWPTTMACWNQNYDIRDNKFDVGAGLQFPSAMNFTQRTALEAALFHDPDAACTGQLLYFYPVHNITQSTYYLTIQSAVAAANTNNVIECAEWTFNEKVNIDKSLTLQGVSEANCIIDGTGLGNGSGITVASGVTNVWIKYFTIRNHAGTSPNLFAGIYAPSGNNGLKVEHCTIKDNVGGSGLYANGPINLLTLNDLDVSGHTAIAGAARGIVVWNGLKSNISITNCDVYNNNCCGIELQDGSASGVTMTNNNVHDNWDSGMSAVGLDGSVGANTISNNTVTNNGRFGIEIKNPNGNGSNITVSNNVVSLTGSFVASRPTEKRDLAGIAAFRRGVLGTNVDVPTGVDIIGNTVSGYVQDNGASASEGFGIVVEGTNHTVTGNTVTGNDVGIQQQAGHLPYPGDGDQNDLADTYFGRGNSAATCGNTVSGNTLSNTIDTRNVGAIGSGFVANTTTGETFCSIQAGVNDAQTLAGHTLSVSAGSFNEDVSVNKQLTILGAGIGQSIVSGPIGGAVSTFQIGASGVIIDGFSVTRDGNNVTDWNNPGLNTAGLAVQGLTANVEVRNSSFYGNRTGIDVNNSNGNNIHNNLISNNRTGLIFRNQTDNTSLMQNKINNNWTVGILFLDASGGTNSPVQSAANSFFNNNDLSGNWYGQIVDRQSGGSLPAPGTNLKNFECNWYGTTNPQVSTANSSEPGYAAQIPVAYGGTATPPGGQPDILGPASANFDYTPWTINGTDNDLVAVGFQPVPNSCLGTPVVITLTLQTNVSCFGGNNGALDISVSGGSNSYAYSWTGGATTQDISGLVAGPYTVVVTDAVYGGTASATYTITQPTQVTATAGSNSPVYAGNTLNLTVMPAGGTPGYTYNWTGPNSFTSTAQNPSIANVTTAANGTYSLTVTDANGCFTVTTTNVIVYGTALYVNDNSLTGDHYTAAVGNNANPGTPAAPFATLAYAISVAQPGNTIWVDAGLYVENPTVNKALTINGSNMGTAGSAPRPFAESTVRTSGNQTAVITVTAGNVVLDGLWLEGDDPSLTGGATASGDDANVSYGVRPTAGANLTVRNNILKHMAIGLRADYAATGTTITRNWFDAIGNFDFGYAVSIRNNFYADVTDNKMTRVWTGLHANNHNGAGGPASWLFTGNEVHSYAAGLCYWLQYNGATGLTVSNNQLFAETGAVPNNFGILVVSNQDAVNPSFTNNTITGTEYGIGLFNVPTSNTITLGATNTISGTTKAGILLTNNLNFNPVGTTNFLAGGPGAASTVNLAGIGLSSAAGGTGIRLDATGGTATTLNFTLPTTLNGGATGLSAIGATAAITGNTLANVRFSGQTGDYITLANNAFTGLQLDATATQFNALTGAGMSLPQLFATEDKITHRIDDNTLGFILVNAGNDYVTTSSFVLPATTAANIQRGIDAASSGYTVNVAAGSYNNNLSVNKALTLSGANFGVNCAAGRGAESVISGVLGNNTKTIDIQSDGVTINGFTISNPAGSYGIYTEGRSNLSVQYNLITNIGNSTAGQYASYGVAIDMGNAADMANVTVSNNCVSNVRGGTNTSLTGTPAKNNNGSGVGIGAGFSTANFSITGLTISDNLIDNITASTVDFTNGGKGAYGVLINVGANPANAGKAVNPLIQNNEITNLSGHWAHGIGLEGETPGAQVKNNYVDNLTDTKPEQDAIGVLLEQNDGAATVQIHDNSFETMELAIKNLMGPTVNATCNWYDVTAAAAVAARISGNVTYTPWMIDGTDNSGNRGFQPAPNSCEGEPVVIVSAVADHIVCGETTGSISVTYSGGSPNYTVSWTGAGMGSSPALPNDDNPYLIASLAAGTYNILVTDGNGSTATTSVQVLSLPVTNTTTSVSYPTIQAAVTAAAPTNIIEVCRGTYAENIIIDKALTLNGPQDNVDADTRFAAFIAGPNGPKADPTVEAIITAPVSNPTAGNPNANDLIRVQASGVTINGFVLDGNNPDLAGPSTLVSGGIDIDARRAITNLSNTDGFNPVNNLTVKYNIIQNVAQRGVSLANNGPVSTGNLITENVIRNFGADPVNGGQAVILFTNAYADVTNNTIDVPQDQIGLHLQNFFANGTMSWTNNDLTVGQDAFGIHVNLFYAPAATLTINNNKVNAAGGVMGTSGYTWGINLWSVQVGSTAALLNNTVGGAGGQFARGINLWNLPTTNTVSITGGTVGRSLVGINLDNIDPFFGAGTSSTVNVSGTVVSGGDVGIRARAESLTPAPGSGSNTVNGNVNLNLNAVNVTGAMQNVAVIAPAASAPFTASATIDGNSQLNHTGMHTGTGVLVSGSQASATVQNNQLSIHGNLIGIDVDGGTVTVQNNHIYDNTTGIRFLNGGTGTVNNGNNFDGGVSLDNGKDIQLTATAGTVLASPNNSFAGDVYGIENLTTVVVDATSNYWEDPSGPGPVGPGSGANITTYVRYCPWLDAPNGMPVTNLPVENTTTNETFCSIQEAIDDAQTLAGHTIEVGPGTYYENVTINKNGLTLRSTGGKAVTTIQGSLAGGSLGTVLVPSGINGVTIGESGNGFTIIGFDGTGAAEAAAVYLAGAHNDIRVEGNEIRANGDEGLLTDFNAPINRIVINDNMFTGKTFLGAEPGGCGSSTQFVPGNNVPRQLVVIGGGAGVTNSMNVAFTNNMVTGTTGGYNSAMMCDQSNSLVTIDVIGAEIRQNTFNGLHTGTTASLRTRGHSTSISCNYFESDLMGANAIHIFFGSANPFDGTAAPNTLAGVAAGNAFPDGGAYLTPNNANSWVIYKDVTQATAAATLIGAGQTAVAASATLNCPVLNDDTGELFPTIQAAIYDPQTLDGHTIIVPAGTYVETVKVTKELNIFGPNAAINPCTGTREPEAIIMPPTSQPFYDGSTEVRLMEVEADNVSVKGFTFDGDNPALTNSLGGPIDAADGLDVYEDVGSLTVQNNIFRNLNEGGVTGYPSGSVAFAGNTISSNKFDNLPGINNPSYPNSGYGIGVLIYNDFYATVDNNCMTDVRIGVQTGNYHLASPGAAGSINNNTISSDAVGIFHNLHYQAATPFTIATNTLTSADPANTGLVVWSMLDNSNAVISSNTISGGDVGIELWNLTTPVPITIQGGSVTGAVTGVKATNFSPYSTSGASNAILDNVTIQNNTNRGIWVEDNAGGTHPVALTIQNGTDVLNSVTGVYVENSDASFMANNAFITGNTAYGVRTSSGTATVLNSTVNNNGIGLLAENGATVNAHQNSITGNTNGATNSNPSGMPVVDADLNWWGNANGPGGAGPGMGDAVSTFVEYCPWLNAAPPTGVPVTPTVTILVSETSGLFNNDATICSGASVTLNALTTAATAYAWSPNNQTSSSITEAPLGNTLYTVSVTFPGCVVTDDQQIQVDPIPVINPINDPAPYCPGESISIPVSDVTNSPLTVYTVSGGASVGIANQTVTGSGNNIVGTAVVNNTGAAIMATVTVTATRNNCTYSSETFVVTVKPTPVINAIADPAPYCPGNAISIPVSDVTGSASTVYTVTGGVSVGIANQTVTGSGGNIVGTAVVNNSGSPIVATVTVTASLNGCTYSSETFDVTVNPSPVGANTTAASCSATSANFNLQTAITNGVLSNFTWYALSNNPQVTGESLTPQSGDVITDVLTTSSNISQAVIYRATPTSEVGSCPGAFFDVTITVYPVPTAATAGPSALCSGSSTDITVTNPNNVAGTVYHWSAPATPGITELGSAQGAMNVPLTTHIVQALTNTTNAPIVVTFTVTPVGPAPGFCAGVPVTKMVTVNPSLPVSVSIAANPGTTICAGTSVTFTATPTNGGASPSYQWFVNGSPVMGATAATYTTTSLANGNTVSVQLTSNALCATGNPATSNVLTMTVNPNLPVSVSIAANPGTTICAGASVTFTATPVNGGMTPSYQWLVNGLNAPGATNSPTYTTTSLANGNTVSVVLTSSEACTTGNPATSNTLTMTVNPLLPVSVSIAANPGTTICAGASVTFTATPVNGGMTPSYQWLVNGLNAPGATNSPTYTTTALAHNDQVSVVLTSSEACTTGNPATSNTLTMTVNPNLPVSVSIAANPGTTLCAGASVTFTATPTNGGVTPAYQWYVNNMAVPMATSATYTTTTLAHNDQVKVVLTSSEACTTGSPATSNILTMTVNPNLAVSVSIAANPGTTICSGNSVTFTATPTNGGVTPSYQWLVNGVNAPGATNSPSYTTTSLANGNTVSVVLTSSETCTSGNPATSNVLTMTVTNCSDISGKIIWEGNRTTTMSGVNDVTVTLSGDASDVDVTLANGLYSLTATMGTSFTVTPKKNKPMPLALSGVSTADASRIQQHITGSLPLNDPYKIIAADVNKTNSVTTQDVSTIVQAVLGNPAAQAFFVNTTWRFVPKAHVFANPNNPFVLPFVPFPETITLSGGAMNQDFIGMKLGDVNDATVPAFGPSLLTPELNWTLDDQWLVAGEELVAEFRADHFDELLALQFALQFNPEQLQLLDIQTIAGSPLQAGNFGTWNLAGGEIRAAMALAATQSVPDGTPVFRLRFKALAGGAKLSQVLQLNHTVLKGEAYAADYSAGPVSLAYNGLSTGVATPDHGELSLLQNRPNPFHDATRIGFILPQGCEAQLRVFDVSGRLVAEENGTYGAGYHELEFHLGQFAGEGVLYYELITPYGTLAKKMVLVRE